MKKIFILFILSIFLFPLVLAEPAEIDASIYVLNLGKFDISTGSFTADFYLSMICKSSCKDSNFEFMNGRATSVDKIIDNDYEKFYRIQASLVSPVDLRDYPFDTQIMQIILEDKTNTIDKIVYYPDLSKSGIDDSIIFTGWQIQDWNVTLSEHYYPVYDETYSQYTFNIPIKRAFFNSFVKTFLPVIFIILVMLSSFILDPDKITTRLSMVGSALVASVMFHVSLSNQIPAVGYLTFADKFMILTYFVVLLSFGLNVYLLELHERKNHDYVERVHRMTEFSMFIVVPILYIILFLFL